MCASVAFGQTGTDVSQGDWPDYNGNMAAQRYSPLDQINAENVNTMKLAWRFSTANFGPTADFNNPSTPLEIDGILYAHVGTTRDIVALDATTGQVLWLWRQDEGQRFSDAPRKGAGRGPAFWTDGDETRVMSITPGFHLVSLDAKTGLPDPNFGENGIVDLMDGLRNADDFEDVDIGASAPPFVMNDVIVVGPALRVGMRPRSKSNVKGDVRGYDARTGEHLWTFKTIPERGEVGIETWLDEGVDFTGNAGVWAPMSGDPELGLVYLPVEMPTGDYYGGNRPGDTLFGGTTGGDQPIIGKIFAVNADTGARTWTFEVPRDDQKSWPGDSRKVGGGSAWLPGTYDPTTDTIYIGTSNAAPDFDRSTRMGDNLYTATLLALDPKTGAVPSYWLTMAEPKVPSCVTDRKSVV